MTTVVENRREPVGESKGHTEKYLTFSLAGEEYGAHILRVREIVGAMDITRVPRMPEFVRGVVNLRGRVIPVIDLRLRFGIEKAADTRETCMVVADIGEMTVGMIVDRVSEVLDIADTDIEAAPSFGMNVDTEFISGIGKTRNRVIMLLEMDRVLSDREIPGLHNTVENTN